MHLIEDSLFLGSRVDAMKSDNLLSYNITHILSIRAQPIPLAGRSEKINYEFIKAEDEDNVDLLNTGILDYAVEHIQKVINGGGKILVNCDFGISRSTTLVVAYLMRRHKITVDEALGNVKKVREYVWPNGGFLRQLQVYEKIGCKVEKGAPHYDIKVEDEGSD